MSKKTVASEKTWTAAQSAKEADMCKGCGCLRGKTSATVVKHEHEHRHGDVVHSHPHDHDGEHTHDQGVPSTHTDHEHQD